MIIAMLSQSLMSLVDAALVGPIGKNALAVIGAGSSAMLVALALIAGVSSGVQAQVARRIGEGQHQQCAMPVNHGILIAFIFALPLSILLVIEAPLIIKAYTSDITISTAAITYFQIRVMSLTAAVMNLSFRGYWNAIFKPHGFLKILLISHILNAVTSYLLIYGKLGLPALGTNGAAVGTCLSMYLCTLLNIRSLRKTAKGHGLFTLWQNKKAFMRLINLALPDSIQQTLFAVGIMLLYVVIAQLGTADMAISHVLTTLSLLLILPGVGIGISTTTLVSQSLGANEPNGAWQWGKDALLVTTILLSLLGLPFILEPAFFLSLFLHEPTLVAAGQLPLQLLTIGIILDTGALVLPQALLGSGANKTVLYVRFFFQWVVLLPCCWLVGPVMGLGLSSILLVQIGQRLLSSLSFIYIWHRRKWATVSI